ncbi:MAG: MFS transporter [Deltaproteobacteria bacterium]|nr:MFS transporter [Deltaproteobacteria bacterium]
MAAALYVIGFYQRVAPAVMTSELMGDFGIGAAGLGTFSAFYYYFYAAFQVPSGILVDSWGPRRLLTLGSIAAAVGTFIFALAGNFFLACLGRAIIGGSAAVAWVSLLKLSSHWLPSRQFAMASGLALFGGILGAVTAGVPLRLLIDQFGWRPSILVSGVITLVFAGTTWIFVRDDPSARGFRSLAPVAANPRTPARKMRSLRGLGKVLTFRNTWLLAFSGSGLIGPVLAFSGLWGVPFLMVRFDLTPASAAALCSLLMVCWAIGGPVLGGLSDRIGRRKPLYLAGCLVALGGWVLIIFIPFLPFSAFVPLIVITGFASGANIIGFAFGKESVPLQLSGTVTGVVNMGNMIAPMVLPPLIGWILDRMWAGQLAAGTRIYDLAAFRAGFMVMLGCSLLALILIILTKETHCRQKTDQ